ncbi:hypothetical protein A2U01_0051985, partial [Trifolium medium]|nr:hypothetical protein [Trifolium medium]
LTTSNIVPPNFTYQQPIITPTTVTHHNFQQYQDPIPSPKPTPFIHHPNPQHFNTTYVHRSVKVEGQTTFSVFKPTVAIEIVEEGVLTVLETDEKSTNREAVKKKLDAELHNPPLLSASPCDSDHIESLNIRSLIDDPMSLVPAKHSSIPLSRPSFPP